MTLDGLAKAWYALFAAWKLLQATNIPTTVMIIFVILSSVAFWFEVSIAKLARVAFVFLICNENQRKQLDSIGHFIFFARYLEETDTIYS